MVVLELFGPGFKGFYIEAGGHHPTQENNTFLLDQKGWDGLVIEPQKRFNSLYSIHRSCHLENLALVRLDFGKETVSFLVDKDCDGKTACVVNEDKKHLWRSEIGAYEIVEVPCVTLQSLLDKYGLKHINLLSLDAETYELEILKGIDFSKTTFDLISIEHFNSSYDGFFAPLKYIKSEGLSKKTNSCFYVNRNSFIYEKCFDRI